MAAQHNDIKNNGIQHNDNRHDGIHYNKILRIEIQRCGIQHDDTQYNLVSMIIFCIELSSTTTLSTILNLCCILLYCNNIKYKKALFHCWRHDNQHDDMQHNNNLP